MQLQRFTASCAIVAFLGLAASGAAYAQPHGHGPYGPRHGGPPPHAQGPHHGGHPGWQSGHAGPRHGYHRPPPPPVAHYYHRGAGPQHRWVMGSRIPPQYRAPRYVVNDWRGHRLAPPPHGYHWVQHGSDYLLVAIASGVVTQLILNGIR